MQWLDGTYIHYWLFRRMYSLIVETLRLLCYWVQLTSKQLKCSSLTHSRPCRFQRTPGRVTSTLDQFRTRWDLGLNCKKPLTHGSGDTVEFGWKRSIRNAIEDRHSKYGHCQELATTFVVIEVSQSLGHSQWDCDLTIFLRETCVTRTPSSLLGSTFDQKLPSNCWQNFLH